MLNRLALAHQYDRSSGQVLTEAEVRVSKKQNSDWIGEYKTPSLMKKSRVNPHGARSLFDTAKIQVARQMRSLSIEHLKQVPWPVAQKLWDEIISTRAESFHAWRIFAASNGDHFNGREYRYFLDIKRPPLPIADYFRGITSLDWLTCLRVSPKFLDTTDLVAIAKIKNLAVLDLSDSFSTVDPAVSRFDERIVRTWSELAQTEGAFKHLRVLLFGWQKSVSSWLFGYLASFPSLSVFVVTACAELSQSNRKDWEPASLASGWEARHAKRSAQSMRPLVVNEDFYFGAVSSFLYESLADSEPPPPPDMQLKRETLPVLECWLAGPPAWDHVIKEFPKTTQTVWFDKARPVERHTVVKSSDQSKRVREAETSNKRTWPRPPKRNDKKLRPKITAEEAAVLLADLIPTSSTEASKGGSRAGTRSCA